MIGAFGTITKGLLKGPGGLLKGLEDTEKSPGDLRRLAVHSISRERLSAYADVKKL